MRCQNLKNFAPVSAPRTFTQISSFINQASHTNDAKIDPETIEQSIRKKHPNNDTEKHRQIFPRIRQTFKILAPIWEPVAWHFPIVARLFATCTSEPLGDTPFYRF